MSRWIRYLQDNDISGLSQAHAQHRISISWCVLGLRAGSIPVKTANQPSVIKPALPFLGRESIHLHGTPANDQSMGETAEEIAPRANRCSLFAIDINDRDGSWVSDNLCLAHQFTTGSGMKVWIFFLFF